MSKRFVIILAVLILGFVGFLTIQSKKSSKNNGNNSSNTQPSEHKIGAGKKNVTLVEYGDFQCPSCGTFFPIVEQVKEKYGDDITFQFRNFPLTQIHNNAMSAHRSAEASAKQNKFWEMYAILYSRQQSWSNSKNATQNMEDYATELGLNVEQFKTDFQSSEVNAVINADTAEGNKLGVNSTPTFFLNGKKLEEIEPTVESFSKLIDEAITNSSDTNKENQ